MWMVAASFQRTHSPSRLAWSEGWRPPSAQSAFIYQMSCVNSHSDFFGFSKVMWLYLTGEAHKFVSCSRQFFSGFNIRKIIKIG